jgi:hypothetical protein
MEILGYNVIYLLGYLSVGALILLALATITASILLLIFYRTKKIVLPKIAVITVRLAETPVRHIFWLLGLDAELLDKLVIELINKIYLKDYCDTPYPQRAVFIPQCLRNPECPAPLTEEGIKCLECGRCGLGEVKKICMEKQILFFIAPGSTLIKRMIRRYTPKAILGVGCTLEVKEGFELLTPLGLPTQGVVLLEDGCVNTRVDCENLVEKILTTKPEYNIYQDQETLKQALKADDTWEKQRKKHEKNKP